MSVWHYYDEATGLFADVRFNGSERLARLNAPPGHIPMAGRYDRLSQRVDVHTAEVVSYQPAKPDDDHEWNEKTQRWQIIPEVAIAQARNAEALAAVARAETAQHQVVREALLSLLPDGDIKDRLLAIDQEVADQGLLASGNSAGGRTP